MMTFIKSGPGDRGKEYRNQSFLIKLKLKILTEAKTSTIRYIQPVFSY